MIKIFPIRVIFNTSNITPEQVWQWADEKIENSKVSKIIPLQMEHNSSKTLYMLKGLIEVHSKENVTTNEFASILKPFPPFIQDLCLTFQ